MEQIIESMVDLFGTKIPNELTVFVISLFPVLELRGGLIAARLLEMDALKAFFYCFLGNMVPIPFILLFIRKIFDWMRKWKYMGKIIVKMEKKAEKHRPTIEKYGIWGLFILVAIPLPGTGGWTGALVAAVMDLRMRRALPAIALGVFAAGLIVGGISFGLFANV
ncbi:MAG: small multi-drug export protein [Clostridia bacterium]|nr:small multi-drug export protein [Clostridia bacterium]